MIFSISNFSNYAADEEGNIYKHKKLIAQNIRKDGYLQCSIYNDEGKRKNMLCHRLVLMAFEPIEEYKQVNHKDANRTNNNLNNLEWCTPSENSQHAYDNKLKSPPKGESNGRAKLTEKEVIKIRKILDNNVMSIRAMARKLNMSKTAISRIKSRRSWSHI